LVVPRGAASFLLVRLRHPEQSDIRDLGLQPLSGVRFEGAGSSEVINKLYFINQENFMLKKFLSFALTGFSTLALFACDDDTNSIQALPQDLPQVGMVSSSSEKTVISSSLQGSVESSSSEETVSQSSVSDTLPFDTTGVKPQYISYTIDPDTFSIETREKAGPYLGHYITVEEDVEATCTVMHIYENGKIATGLFGYHDVSNCVLVVRDDSLMFSNVENCRKVPIWGSCYNSEAYSRKIMVGNDVFYFGESKTQLQLTQLTDSTITIWLTANPSYEPKKSSSPNTWKKSDFEGDSMVTFVENKVNPNYVDTIFIDKYGVKITDWSSTWIFENETCTTKDFVYDTTRTPEEQCKDWENYRNGFVDCTARNMNLPEGVYPRLCRPTKIDDRSVWCILDGDYVATKK
jgi:hypothetical protein